MGAEEREGGVRGSFVPHAELVFVSRSAQASAQASNAGSNRSSSHPCSSSSGSHPSLAPSSSSSSSSSSSPLQPQESSSPAPVGATSMGPGRFDRDTEARVRRELERQLYFPGRNAQSPSANAPLPALWKVTMPEDKPAGYRVPAGIPPVIANDESAAWDVLLASPAAAPPQAFFGAPPPRARGGGGGSAAAAAMSADAAPFEMPPRDAGAKDRARAATAARQAKARAKAKAKAARASAASLQRRIPREDAAGELLARVEQCVAAAGNANSADGISGMDDLVGVVMAALEALVVDTGGSDSGGRAEGPSDRVPGIHRLMAAGDPLSVLAGQRIAHTMIAAREAYLASVKAQQQKLRQLERSRGCRPSSHQQVPEDERYTFRVHSAAVAAAVALLRPVSLGRTQVLADWSRRLRAECATVWLDGRVRCDALSLTGRPCVLTHRFVEVSALLDDAASAVHTSSGAGRGPDGDEDPFADAAHDSGHVTSSWCDCGQVAMDRKDPFRFRDAHAGFYSRAACCGGAYGAVVSGSTAGAGAASIADDGAGGWIAVAKGGKCRAWVRDRTGDPAEDPSAAPRQPRHADGFVRGHAIMDSWDAGASCTVMVGFEYECPAGHRFMCNPERQCTADYDPDRGATRASALLPAPRGGSIRAEAFPGSDTPVLRPCPAEGCPHPGRLTRIHVVTPPESQTDVRVHFAPWINHRGSKRRAARSAPATRPKSGRQRNTPAATPTPAETAAWSIPVLDSRPIVLPPGAMCVIRMPYIYDKDGGALRDRPRGGPLRLRLGALLARVPAASE